jgi:hypothetical protein
MLEQAILPKKGRLTLKEKEVEGSEEFISMKRRHSAVESAINALENHGLNMCPDHGIFGVQALCCAGGAGKEYPEPG